MSKRKIYRISRYLLYCIMGAGILYLGLRFYYLAGKKNYKISNPQYHLVNVSGNVEKPGVYRVLAGTSQFQILHMAGIRATSDISLIDLSKEVSANDTLYIKKLQAPVSIAPLETNIRLEFFLGDVNIITGAGRNRSVLEGVSIEQNDRVIVDEGGQAEISINTYSHVDMKGFSELIIDQVGTDESGINIFELFQQSGVCWYRIVYATSSEQYEIVTPFATISVGRMEADFMVTVLSDRIEISNTDGLLSIQRIGTEETTNLVTGETAVIEKNDDEIEVRSLMPEHNPQREFADLIKSKAQYRQANMPLNIMFCGIPNVYFFIHVRFDKATAHLIHLPANTSVGQFVYGVSSISQAFLYGGATLVSSLVERIMNAPISNYILFEKSSVVKLASSFKSLTVKVDEKAAGALGISVGDQKLSPETIGNFLKPSISGSKDAQARQIMLLRTVFDELRAKNIIITSMLAQQVVENMETNFTAKEILGYYDRFTSQQGWKMEEHYLPGETVKKGEQSLYEVNLDVCRAIIKGK